MNKHEELNYQLIIPESERGKRLDQVLAQLLPEHSRARLQEWIKAKYVRLNDEIITKTRTIVEGGEQIDITAEVLEQYEWVPNDLPIDIVFEDDDMIVVNKAAGMVVHPAAGHYDDTLVNALLHYSPALKHLPRAGIIHRIDRDTTGLLVVAKSLLAHTQLVKMLQARDIERLYEAIVIGRITAGGTIDAPIGRHPKSRKKMAVITGGKPAVTQYRVIDRFRAHTHLSVKLETGRTHQIRVHMAHINHAVVGDPTYAGRPRLPKGCTNDLRDALTHFQRQALHAKQLTLAHPRTNATMSWTVPIPSDMQQLLAVLQNDHNDEVQ